MSDLPNVFGITHRVRVWWSNWVRGWRAADELRHCDRAIVDSIARDFGMSGDELTELAAYGPRAAALLYRRLKALGIDAAALAELEPVVLRYFERTCTCCDSKRRCERDLRRAMTDRDWHEYCPNAPAIDALREKLASHVIPASSVNA